MRPRDRREGPSLTLAARPVRKARNALARLRSRKPGEIRGDELAAAIRDIASEPGVETILEIGSATGDGSTRSFVEGAERNPGAVTLFCIEAVADRCAELGGRYADRDFVRPYNVSSVGVDDYASEAEVVGFYRAVPSALNAFPLEQVLGWRTTELEYLGSSGVRPHGIELIQNEHGIDRFDVVLLDGSEFAGRAELERVLGARYVLLDDVLSFKNHANCLRLLADGRYELVGANPRLRNGYAIFRRASR
ncbi:MAG: hypothetical protein M3322_05640 [Actinomycetota bacterium]|nr:hypothetical protein [Actinomycetota bacterium]